MMASYLLLILISLFWITPDHAFACSFPSGLQGVWTTGYRENITITSDFIFNFPIGNLGKYTFRCEQLNGTRYIVKTTTTFNYASLMFSALMCLDFNYVTSDLYYFYMASNKVDNERIFFNLNDGPWSASQVCQLEPEDYIPYSYDVMVKDGNIEAAKLPCPTDITAYWAYNFDQGSGNECTDERSLDICTTGDVSFNYTQCSSEVAYSTTGYLHCLVNVTIGSTTYLTLYNNDSIITGSDNYRMTCWSFASDGSDIYMTQNPKICADDQNATYVDMNEGATLFLFNKTACYIIEPDDLTWLYALCGVLGSLIVIGMVVFLCFLWCQYKAKQKPFRGRLEPPALTPRMNGHGGLTFRPSKIKDSGIPQDDVPINVMQLLRKDLLTPGGRDSPSSSVLLTVNTPPQLYNIRETDSMAPTPTIETSSQRKNYHVLGGIDQSEYGDLPLDDTGSTRTPVMVLPARKPGLASPEQDCDDYDDEDDDLMIDTPGRSKLVAATQGMFGEDPLCPASRLPGIAEENSTAHRSQVGGGRPMEAPPIVSTSMTATTTANIGGGANTNIVFLYEDGQPLPPRTPSPPQLVETVRDKDSKLRVKVTRRASLTSSTAPQDNTGRGIITPRDTRALREPERGEDSFAGEMVFGTPVTSKNLETGNGPVNATPEIVKKGSKSQAALLKSRSAKLDNKRGELERAKEKEQESQAVKKTRPKTTTGARDTIPIIPEAEEPVRPRSSLLLTRVDIPDLQLPPNIKPSRKLFHEVVDSPGRRSLKSAELVDKAEGQTRKMWLDPVRPTDNVWGKMSSAWKEGQSWPGEK